MGLVVARCFEDPNVPAVLVSFYHASAGWGNTLHYYDAELQDWAKDGLIKVQDAT